MAQKKLPTWAIVVGVLLVLLIVGVIAWPKLSEQVVEYAPVKVQVEYLDSTTKELDEVETVVKEVDTMQTELEQLNQELQEIDQLLQQ